jgi:hypothetical protein
MGDHLNRFRNTRLGVSLYLLSTIFNEIIKLKTKKDLWLSYLK